MKSVINRSFQLRALHTFNHLAAIFGLYFYGFGLVPLSIFVWFLIGSFGISIGYHRLLSHRAFRTSAPVTNVLATLGCLATGGSPLGWVGAHRLHHKYNDRKRDPHAINIIGKIRVYFHLWESFSIPRAEVCDLLKNKYFRFLHRNYFTILYLWALFLFSIDPKIGIFVYSLPAVFAFHAFGMINLFGHSHGFKNFSTEDSSTNSWIANLLTWGEGWHNNHHKFPSLYRIGLYRGEFDISAWILERTAIMSNKEQVYGRYRRVMDKVTNEAAGRRSKR